MRRLLSTAGTSVSQSSRRRLCLGGERLWAPPGSVPAQYLGLIKMKPLHFLESRKCSIGKFREQPSLYMDDTFLGEIWNPQPLSITLFITGIFRKAFD